MAQPEAKNSPPVLRSAHKEGDAWVEDLVVWRHEAGPDAKNPGMVYFSGNLLENGKKQPFSAFVREHEGSTFLSLVDAKGDSIGTANPVNGRKDGKEVYFDTLIFNFTKREKPLSVYVTKHCDEDTHRLLGFNSGIKQRPARDEAPEAQEGDDSDSPRRGLKR